MIHEQFNIPLVLLCYNYVFRKQAFLFVNIFTKIVNFTVTFYWSFWIDRNDLAGLMFLKEGTNTFELFLPALEI